MRALPHSAGIRIRSECFVEERVQFSVYSVMQQPVAHRSLVDVAGLGVGNAEVVVPAMAVSLTY